MPYLPLKLNPGIDVEQSPHLLEAGYSVSVAARFFEGLPQKLGGWQRLNPTPFVGIATGLHGWADLIGTPYIGIGTDQRLELFYGGLIGDITPLRKTSNGAPNFSTVINTPTVTIVDAASATVADNWINIVVPVAVGGLIIQGYYQVTTTISANSYTITAASNATATVNNSGAVPLFTTTMGSAAVTVTLAKHGMVAGDTFNVQVSTTVGGIILSEGVYAIVGTPATNTFVITGSSLASSGTAGSENGGNARISYLIYSGSPSAFYNTGAWGAGEWGGGPWGGGSDATVLTPPRQWFLDNYGQYLVGNYTGSPIYVWTPPYTPGNAAVPIDTTNYPDALQPPTVVNVSFCAGPQMIIALGCDDPNSSDFEPLLVRWCDAGNFQDWKVSVTNQAGSYLIPSGSKLVGGISAPNFVVLWTDVDMWLMTYLGPPLVWGFTKISGGAGLLSARAVGIFRNLIFFASPNGFYVFDGNSIRLIPCPVWDKFWFNLNKLQVDLVDCQVNSWFQEVSWAFPSATGDGTVDSRVSYNIRENSWTFDDAPTQTARTAWIDSNVYGAPIGTDSASYLQQHETSNDADGSPLISSVTTGWFAISDGTLFTFIERMVGDFVLTGGDQTVQVTIYVQDWPTDTVKTYGPYTWTPTTGPFYSVVRARGRYAQVKIESVGLGSFWRGGNLRFMTSQAGRR